MTPLELAQAYATCRRIARREAKNFYWAFRVLPRHKSDAMCAIYAFMRKADDLADDESISIDARRVAMAQWTDAWRRSKTEGSGDPVFAAVRDTQQRFSIPDDLLEKLVEGTTLDLQPVPTGVVLYTVHAPEGSARTMQVYETYEALRDYCYLVASVVGLVCIRIFGYSDPRAEQLAIDTGIAFQLTNILRDVQEDALRGRIYLPLELLQQCGSSVDRVLELCAGAPADGKDLDTLRELEQRAELLYRSSTELVPLLDADSRAAMSVLATIYHRLLRRIGVDVAAVFQRRISVPTMEKLAILAGGFAVSAKARVRR